MSLDNTNLILPDYIASSADHITAEMRKVSEPLLFPLSFEDKKNIDILSRKFDEAENCVGLAAPQIGIFKRAIVFAVPDDPALKKWRKNLEQTIAKTIWLNPSYASISAETYEDYEACFSILNTAVLVRRYKKIEYTAYDLDGNLIKGTAEGFLARLMQHEIDHLDGKFFVDNVKKENIMSMEEYKEKRTKAFESINQENAQ